MKELKDIWSRNTNQDHPEFNYKDLENLKERSDSPIKKLKRNIFINSIFGVVFLIGFIALLFIVDGFWFRVFTSILCLSYMAGIFFNNWIDKTYLTDIPMDDSLLSYLKVLSHGMKKAFRAIELAAVFVYPIAMTAGFLIPLTMENKLNLFSEDPFLWILLFVLFLVLTPICFYLNRYMTKLAFGKYVNQIDSIITNLESSDVADQ
ncbi:MAG: hypothetical protein WED33_03010 [Bacteroidia bacterium]